MAVESLERETKRKKKERKEFESSMVERERK